MPEEVLSQPIKELSFDELFFGDIPDVISEKDTLTSQRIDQIIVQAESDGLMVMEQGHFANTGFNSETGRLELVIPNSTYSVKAHELVHVQQMLEAKKAGLSTDFITSTKEEINVLRELQAIAVQKRFLERNGPEEDDDVIGISMHDRFWRRRARELGVVLPEDIFSQNPYSKV